MLRKLTGIVFMKIIISEIISLIPAFQKVLPKLSLYQEVMKRKALKDIQKAASPGRVTQSKHNRVNSDTYTIPRSVETRSKSGDVNCTQTKMVNEMMYKHLCHKTENLFQTMEGLCSDLEAQMGQANFLQVYNTLKDSISSQESYESLKKSLDAEHQHYIPAILHLIQLEIFLKQSTGTDMVLWSPDMVPWPGDCKTFVPLFQNYFY